MLRADLRLRTLRPPGCRVTDPSTRRHALVALNVRAQFERQQCPVHYWSSRSGVSRTLEPAPVEILTNWDPAT